LRVTIAGCPFPHLFFEFILSHSGWSRLNRDGPSFRGDL
jgi:hypothetical protein